MLKLPNFVSEQICGGGGTKECTLLSSVKAVAEALFFLILRKVVWADCQTCYKGPVLVPTEAAWFQMRAIKPQGQIQNNERIPPNHHHHTNTRPWLTKNNSVQLQDNNKDGVAFETVQNHHGDAIVLSVVNGWCVLERGGGLWRGRRGRRY